MKMKSPITRPTPTGEFQLTFPYDELCTDGDGNFWHIHVAAGFVFDGASIPRGAWSILGYSPMSAAVQAPALIHDWLYSAEALSRATCDQIFREDLRRNGVPWLARRLMYRAVRLGGGVVWSRHKPGLVDIAKTYGSISDLV